jgi:hypothetical protein
MASLYQHVKATGKWCLIYEIKKMANQLCDFFGKSFFFEVYGDSGGGCGASDSESESEFIEGLSRSLTVIDGSRKHCRRTTKSRSRSRRHRGC